MILQIPCPKCNGSIEKTEVSDLVIYRCLMCGFRKETNSLNETTAQPLY